MQPNHNKKSNKFRLGLVINPYAGIGGALALKGSDGAAIRTQALAAGADKLANQKTQLALSQLIELSGCIEVFAAAGEMGAELAQSMGFDCHCVFTPASQQTESEDTQHAVQALLAQRLDLLLFAGGDGTARDIYTALEHAEQHETLPVLGIPAGVKIHSGVYAVTPAAAGRVAAMLINGQIVSATMQEVRDIDEQAFRQNRISAKYYGELLVPSELRYVQAVKMAGKESEPLVLDDIASWVVEQMQDDPQTYYIMGSGSTVAHIMQHAQLENTLLGVDVVQAMRLVAKDVSAHQLLDLIQHKVCKLVVTPIGNQGHVFGRGNQQLSAEVIRQVGRHNILLVATKNKLQGLAAKPLIADTQDAELDAAMSGLVKVTTGYQDQVLYPLISYSNNTSFAEQMPTEAIAECAQHFFDQIVVDGSDEELFASSYLSGHFDLVLSQFPSEQAVDLVSLDHQIRQSLADAFANGELPVEEQQQVRSSWLALLSLLSAN